MRKQIAIILLSSSSIAMAETAQTISEPWYERDRLSGNWAGERDSLEASGVAPFIVSCVGNNCGCIGGHVD